MKPAAVFDLDGTMVRGTSAERLFVPYLVRAGVVRTSQLAAALSTALSLPVAGRTAAIRSNKRYLAGLGRQQVVEHACVFVRRVLERRFAARVVARLEILRARGYLVCLLTGAPDFIAQAVCRRFALTDAIGTGLEVCDGRFTGRLDGPHYFAETKRTGVEELVRRHAIDLGRSIGFADHWSDVPFLECFGQAVAVEPGRALRREAQRRGWEVLDPP